MKRNFVTLLVIALLFSFQLSAQNTAGLTGAELVYVDGAEFTVTYADGTVFDFKKGGINEGDLIPVGAMIKTGPKTLAELRIKPNRSIIKLSRGSQFKLESVATPGGGGSTSMSLASGKLRAIAARISGAEEFKIRGQTAVCGVRGTDFTFAASPGKPDRLLVKQGLVDLWRLMGQSEDLGSKVSVGTGQYVDAFGQGFFSVLAAGQDIINEGYQEMEFQRASESEVPGHDTAASPLPSASASPLPTASPLASASPSPSATPSPTESPKATESPSAGQSPSPSATASSSTEPSSSPLALASPTPGPTESSSPSPKPSAKPKATPKPKPVSGSSGTDGNIPDATGDIPDGSAPPPSVAQKPNPFLQWLAEFMNAEIGAIQINDVTYSKAVLQPVIELGKTRTALYLPIIYQTNLFDPADWYHPQGNDEWSFGTDIGWQNNTLGALTDAAQDLALKIKFFEYGDQQFDPFFIKVGNLSTFTLGHGLLMQNYANDAEFPVIRRVGANIGFNVANKKPFGMELLANDLSAPQIFGGRILIRPAKNSSLAIGLSGIVDTAPASILNTEAAPDVSASFGDPLISGVGIDIDIPILNTDLAAFKLFADAGAIAPYVRREYAIGANVVSPGYKVDLLWNAQESKVQNWGAIAGALGTVASVFNWRLEMRYSNGSFTHNFFDRNYDANRGRIAAGYASMIADPSVAAALPEVMGVYGEGGFSVLKEKLVFSLGYFWPWSPEYGLDIERQMGVLSQDKLHAQLDVKKGLVPKLDISGSISYDRSGFASSLASGLPTDSIMAMLFDENTSFKGELVLPVPKAPMLDIALLFGTAPARDAQGDLIFVDEAGLRPQMAPVFSLETRLHF